MNKNPMAVSILPNVFLGDQKSACSEAFFKQADIRAVLNMTSNVPNYFACLDDVEYIRIPVHDTSALRDTDQMFRYFPIITEFIHKNSVIEGKNVLVHCAKGRQRSCAGLSAYLIKFYRMSPMDTVSFLTKRKVDAFNYGRHVNFSKSLNRWYERRRRVYNLNQA